jgi:NAD(P)-dependent dehydrogenase (short-subunit alcohol dehydrogenase family)
LNYGVTYLLFHTNYFLGGKVMLTTSIKGHVVIITGAGTGLGLATAKCFAKEGCNLVITGRRESKLLEAKKTIEGINPEVQVLVVPADNCDKSSAKKIVDAAIKRFGRIDVLVNNAQSFPEQKPMIDCTDDEITAVYGSGVFGAWRLMQAAFPYLKETKGTVINISSGADTANVEHTACYASNKAALRSISRIAAKEWGPLGITVNVVNPYCESEYGATLFSDDANPEVKAHMEAILASVPLRHLGNAEKEVSPVCVFLATPEGHYMTGMTFEVDGGTTIRV